VERVRLSRKLCALVALGLVAAVVGGLGLYPLVRESIEIGRLGDPEARSAAVEALRELRSRRAVPHLVALLDDEDQNFRREVLQALVDIGLDGRPGVIAKAVFECTESTEELKYLCSMCVKRCRGFVPALLSEAASHCDVADFEDMTSACTACLEVLYRRPASTLPYLEPFLHETPAHARVALDILAMIGPSARDHCSSVVGLLGHPDGSVRLFAGRALEQIHCCEQGLCDAIEAAARDDEPHVREWISGVMGVECAPCRDNWVVGLGRLCHDESTKVQLFALESIRIQGFAGELEKELCDLIAEDTDEEVRVAVAKVIWEATEEDRFLGCVEALLAEKSELVRFAAAALVYKARPTEDLRKLLEQALQHGNDDVRSRAFQLLEPSTR
jgi:HEAT repeat protein